MLTNVGSSNGVHGKTRLVIFCAAMCTMLSHSDTLCCCGSVCALCWKVPCYVFVHADGTTSGVGGQALGTNELIGGVVGLAECTDGFRFDLF